MNFEDSKLTSEKVAVANRHHLRDIEEGFDPEFEKNLVKKLDRHIVPITMLLYLFSFLDRYAEMVFIPFLPACPPARIIDRLT
jgi:hypothetical protein